MSKSAEIRSAVAGKLETIESGELDGAGESHGEWAGQMRDILDAIDACFPRPAEPPARQINQLTAREACTVLAALRRLQTALYDDSTGSDEREEILAMDHFESEKPLANEEIDALCERINIDWTADEPFTPEEVEKIHAGIAAEASTEPATTDERFHRVTNAAKNAELQIIQVVNLLAAARLAFANLEARTETRQKWTGTDQRAYEALAKAIADCGVSA
jgi:hypothetical protein